MFKEISKLKILSGESFVSENDKIFHFLEFGLGDTVNSISIIKGTKRAYPRNQFIIICEKRWINLVKPYLSKSDVIYSYDAEKQTYKDIFHNVNKIFSNEKGFFLPYMLRFPDQWAHGDSKQEALVRNLSLQNFIPEVRPEIPFSEDRLRSQCLELLARNNLKESEYIVLAPNIKRKSKKFWDQKSFEELVKAILLSTNLKVVVVGTYGETELIVDGIVKFDNLSILEVGFIISKSACFIGLDSGLSHVSATFNIPSIILYPYFNQDVMPFEVKVHSAIANLFIKNKESPVVSYDLVFLLLQSILKSPKTISYCPACGRVMCYIVFVSGENIIRKCVCGLKKVIYEKIYDIYEKFDLDFKIVMKDDQVHFDMPDTIKKIEIFLSLINEVRDKVIIVTFREQHMTEKRTMDFFIWSVDSVLLFFKNLGFFPLSVQKKVKNSTTSFFFSFSAKKSDFEKSSLRKVPWGENFLYFKRWDLYFAYFSWGDWGNEYFLNQLSKKIYLSGNKGDSKEVAIIVFKSFKSIKSFKNLLKIFTPRDFS